MRQPANQKSEFTFEQGLKKLESLVETLENGELGLEELVKKYEEGTQLIEHCQTHLKLAELKVLELKKRDGKSEATLGSFEE